MRILRLFLICIFSCFATVTWAWNQLSITTSDDGTISLKSDSERIIRFHADIKVDTTGRVEVTEHIRIYALGMTFSHGITRTIPKRRKDHFGRFHLLPTKVLGATHNGQDETYYIEDQDENIVIFIGQPRVYIDDGPHDYTITYESYCPIRHFDDYDELYWNVTGYGTEEITDEASATVTMPLGVRGIRAACYTDGEYSTARNCTFNSRKNVYIFQSSQALQSHEGLTVAVAFPKGAIHQYKMPWKEHVSYYWQRYHAALVPIGITLAYLLYVFISWFCGGRNTYKPTVIPQFRPPRGYSPAVISCLYFEKFDSCAFAGELVNMAMHGGTKIVPKYKKNHIEEYTFFAGETDMLNEEDRLIYNCLFNKKQRCVKYPGDDYKDAFLSAYKKLRKKIIRKSELKEHLNIMTLKDFVDIIMPFIVFGLMLALSSFVMVFLVCMPIPFIAWYIYFFRVKPLLSKDGADLKAEVDGFYLYMKTAKKTAEGNRHNGMAGAPEHTPELFEELLPYAIALKIGNEWCDRFRGVLSRIEYSPEWYVTVDSFASAARFSTLVSFMNMCSTQTQSNYDVQYPSDWTGSSDSGGGGGGYGGGGGSGGGTGGW